MTLKFCPDRTMPSPTGDPFKKIEAKIANITYTSANEDFGLVHTLASELWRTDPSFKIFYEELVFEGYKLSEPLTTERMGYVSVDKDGSIVTRDNSHGGYPSNIDFINCSAFRLAGLKYYIELKKEGRTYEYGNIDSFKARLGIDLGEIVERQKQKERDSVERDRIYNEKIEENIEEHRSKIHSEVPKVFENFGLPLNYKLENMLMEPREMQGERQGSGYTNIFRELSNYINKNYIDPIKLFDENKISEKIGYKLYQHGTSDEKIKALNIEENLKKISEKLTHPSHILFVNMILDIILGSKKDLTPLPVLDMSKKREEVGTCTTAERYYFEWEGVQKIKNFQGMGYDERMRLITDESGNPILLEKGNGNKSCLSLVPLKMGNVEVPAGSMIQAIEKSGVTSEKINSPFLKEKLSINDFDGFVFLRISTLSLPPEYREEAFGNHYFFQMEQGFANYNWLEIKHYNEIIESELKA